jgi:hypothetical protein
MNFTLQDIFGSVLAFLIFPLILVFPGYVISWKFNIFNFNQRQIYARHIIALVVSVAVVPILVYLLSMLASILVAKLTIVVFLILYIFINIVENNRKAEYRMGRVKLTQYQKVAFFIAAGWVSFLIMSLVDLQLGNHLYYNVASYDFATRVSMVNAITRTGVPPVNPGYFPGHPANITSVYYFWYIFCSLVDQFGGRLVDSRLALIAGDAWCGLAIMSLIALYLKFRSMITGNKAWRNALIGISLLAISGLDVIPVSIDMITTRYSYGFMWPPGDLELWNTQITAWVGSLFWVPHHVAAMIACMMGFLLFQNSDHKAPSNKLSTVIIVGLAFASAIGLSTWVAIVFSIFWGMWILILIVQKKDNVLISMMMSAGLLALIFATPFLLGILKGGTGASGLPIAIEVRRFTPMSPYLNLLLLSNFQKNILYLMLLPINYLMELGFFLVIGLLWLQQFRNKKMINNSYYMPEIILLCVVFVVCSFVRSAILSTNDLGWRGWLFGQFILLIWAIDIHELHPLVAGYLGFIKNYLNQKIIINTKRYLVFLLFIGVLTSIVDVALLRFYPILVDK